MVECLTLNMEIFNIGGLSMNKVAKTCKKYRIISNESNERRTPK